MLCNILCEVRDSSLIYYTVYFLLLNQTCSLAVSFDVWLVVKKNYEERRQYFDQIKAKKKAPPPQKKNNKIKMNTCK